jgi:hypothetical protein
MHLPFYAMCRAKDAVKKKGGTASCDPLRGYLMRIHPSDFSLLPRDAPFTSQVLLVETQWVPLAVLLQRYIWTELPVVGLLG